MLEINVDLKEILPQRMRFTMTIDDPQCYINDHTWGREAEMVSVTFRKDGPFVVLKCARCGKKGFVMDETVWEMPKCITQGMVL